MRKARVIILILFCAGCLDPYSPPASSGNLNALVVDGYIDADGSAHVKLSRSLSLDNQGKSPKEGGATVTVEASGGEVFSLQEDSVGLYRANELAVDYDSKYTLHIITSDKKEYKSDEIKIYPTPAIDSVYWTIDDIGRLVIRADSHETNANTTDYFLTNAVETYEYHAAVLSDYIFVDKKPIVRRKDQQIYTCYRNLITPNILHTTKGLTNKLMSGMKLSVIERSSQKISVRYSILVQQRTISEEESTYLRQLQVSSEQQGSLFAPTPGAIISNVRPITDPDEYVLGYFRGQELKTFRYFISTTPPDHLLPKDFRQPAPNPGCQTETTCQFDQQVLGPNQCVDASSLGDDTIITNLVLNSRGATIAYVFVRRDCGDCTVFGGVTTKPPFW